MTNRDTYDILEAERLDKESTSQQVITNIQILLMMGMMRDAEPDLFGNGKAQLMQQTSDMATSIYSMHPWILVYSTFSKMVEITKWHAAVQVEFWEDLMKSVSDSGTHQG